jgi:uncharacterized membrane protein YgaE (UPF0421/DUF939 family)
MTYVLIGLIILIIAGAVTTFIFNKMYRKYKTAYEQEHNKLLGIQEEYSKLAEAYRIKKENKEKADAEISDLHNGVTTADDILPKRKSRA